MTQIPCYTSLGRFGDVLNCLPLARRYFDQTGVKPYFQVAAAYADILDGVSYVEPVIYPGEFSSGILALHQARQLTEDIRLCQIYGFGLNPGETCTSFARQSWVSAGADVPWGSLPLVLDRRNPFREASLKHSASPWSYTPKLVLVALNGQSSPFPYRGLVINSLLDSLGNDFTVIDLCAIKAHRFYDLLGLFDVAHCLVTVDTGHLHLAHASNVPVVSFVTRDPSAWHGSPWRPNHVGRFFYDETPEHIYDMLFEVRCAGCEPLRPKLIHTWSDWREWPEGSPDAKRIAVAQASWQTEYALGMWIPAEHKRTRNSRSGLDIGDPHAVAFAKDTIENALSLATKDSDIICLTNSDTGFCPGLTAHILEQVGRYGAAYSHRRDFDSVAKPFISESQVRLGEWFPGSDAFFFSVEWWQQHKEEYGDFVLGRAHWDEVFRQVVKYHGGGNIVNQIWHAKHDSFWFGASEEEMQAIPGNVHNDKIRQKWFSETGFQPEDFRYFRCSELSHLHPYPRPPVR